MSSIDPAPLANNDQRVEVALAKPEDDHFEVKRVVGKLGSALETVIAFANRAGGTLVLGLEDPRKASGKDRVYGVEERPDAITELRTLIATRIRPPLPVETHFHPIPCTLRDGSIGSIVAVVVRPSSLVHSTADGETFVREGASNRRLGAEEIVALAHRRGGVSAVDAPVEVPVELLQTNLWRDYASQRRLTRPIAEQLPHLGLAKAEPGGGFRPTRAAVLLFAEQPGNLLNEKCAIRVFHYRGDRIERDAQPNLVRTPRTISGPLITLIPGAVQAIIDELASGVQMGPFGFEIVQSYPKRVITEAITNAVLHRDYRLQADIQVRIFSNRIEVESPGVLPHGLTASTLLRAGSRPRNRSLVDHLREFPAPPNLDGGEGVPMMFQTMARGNLYPPIYLTHPELDREAVLVRLSNQAKPSAWDQVDHLLRGKPFITNADVRSILNTDNPIAASRLIRGWVDTGLLVVVDQTASKRDRRYRRPGTSATQPFLEPEGLDGEREP